VGSQGKRKAINAPVADFRSKKAVMPLVAEILFPVNVGSQPVEATMPLQQFVETVCRLKMFFSFIVVFFLND
jgi:hypothetical protein